MHCFFYMKRERKRQRLEEEEERKMEVVVVEKQEDALATAVTVAVAAAAEMVKEEEELWGMRLDDGEVLADELMTWNTIWVPSCWDVEFVEKNYGVLFDDVVWDDDIWNLNISSTQLPPLDNTIRQD